MINNVVLVGRITRDPELRKTQSGQSVCSFTIAVNRTFTNQQGDREADFINCVVWGRAAENMTRYVVKGALLGIDGRVQSRNYDGADGRRVFVTEIVCNNVQFLEPRGSRGDMPRSANPVENNGGYYQGGSSFDSEPSVAEAPSEDFFQVPDLDEQFGKHPATIDISDDDVPF